MEERVYCVIKSEIYGEGSCVDQVFRSKDKVEKYCKIQEQLDPDYVFYIVERTFYDTKFDENVKISSYYNYTIIFDEEDCDNNDINEYCSELEPERQIYTYDDYVVLREDSIDAYSTESYTKAKAIAINEYEKQRGRYFNSELKYESFDKRKINDYLSYDTQICPICGGKIKHPYTGMITDEQLEEDLKTCQLIEVIDENNVTLGYRPLCKKGIQ